MNHFRIYIHSTRRRRLRMTLRIRQAWKWENKWHWQPIIPEKEGFGCKGAKVVRSFDIPGNFHPSPGREDTTSTIHWNKGDILDLDVKWNKQTFQLEFELPILISKCLLIATCSYSLLISEVLRRKDHTSSRRCIQCFHFTSRCHVISGFRASAPKLRCPQV